MARRRDQQPVTTKTRVQQYETTAPLLEALYLEIQTLSKKKPEATLNASKVTLINRLLADIQELLKEEPGIKYLDQLDDDELPQYSDVVLVLSQFSAAMKAYHSRYYGWSDVDGTHKWFTK